jgi:phosphoadenosine phosphosulfate reductase
MDLAALFSRHQRVMLQFSAGKDSAACLYLLEPFWGQLTVAWMNPGNPTREVTAYMERISKLVPNFLEVKGKQPEWIRQNGYPVDVLPFPSTRLGRIAVSKPVARFAPAESCCRANMWEPLAQAVIAGDYTAVIRGQKACDSLKIPVISGQVIDGIEYVFPLEGWSDEDVFEFIGPNLPPSYARGLRSSIDCRNCTAYAEEHQGLVEDLLYDEPEAATEIRAVHLELADQLSDYLATLKGC